MPTYPEYAPDINAEYNGWNCPKKGQIVSPFQQSYKYLILAVIPDDKHFPNKSIIVKLIPYCDKAKIIFEQQYIK